MLWFKEHYLPDPKLETTRACPRSSRTTSRAFRRPSWSRRASIRCATKGRAYADRMRDAGVKVEYVCSEGSHARVLQHGRRHREAARVLDLAADRLREALARPEVASAA